MSTPVQARAESEWWHDFFDETYAEFGLASAHPEEVGPVVEFLIDRLHLEPGDRLFDQCCGIGRLSLPLAERGIRIEGVDLSRVYIDRAAREAADRTLPCAFHCGDAFEFVAPEPCDAAINWFTSFGYDADDERNCQMIRRAYESLKPGGRFALDTINNAMVLADFRPCHIERRLSSAGAELVVLVEATPDLARGMLDQQWTFLRPDGSHEARPLSLRLLMPHEIVRLIERAGFRDVELVGSVAGEPLSMKSRRCIATAVRP